MLGYFQMVGQRPLWSVFSHIQKKLSKIYDGVQTAARSAQAEHMILITESGADVLTQD